jgi:hypothetical protein
MTINATEFRALWAELIDENALACRGVLGLCAVEFTPDVATAAVSLGERSVFRVNLDFVRTHCTTPEHVKALILHELLHVLLGHTRRFTHATPALNLAADAVINAMIHRQLGTAYSSFFRRYYTRPGVSPLLLLLCPSAATDNAVLQKHLGPDWPHTRYRLERGDVALDDMRALVEELNQQALREALRHGVAVLLGNHDWAHPDLPPWLSSRLDEVVRQLHPTGGGPGWGQALQNGCIPLARDPALTAWDRTVAALLRRLVSPDPQRRRIRWEEKPIRLPVLHPGDRRAALQSAWSPFLPEATWPLMHPRAQGTTAVYLDVSGSMNAELQRIASLLHHHREYLRLPIWAFSDQVEPAEFRRGSLVTRTTGGTRLGPVFQHLATRRPEKALIITDGYVETPRGDWAEVARRHQVEFLISANGTDQVLAPLARPCTQLAKLPNIDRAGRGPLIPSRPAPDLLR